MLDRERNPAPRRDPPPHRSQALAAPGGDDSASPLLPAAWSPAGGARPPSILHVRPSARGWRLSGADLEPVYFLSSIAAERHGRRVAHGLAEAGCDTVINLHDACGHLVSAVHIFGDERRGRADAAIRAHAPAI